LEFSFTNAPKEVGAFARTENEILVKRKGNLTKKKRAHHTRKEGGAGRFYYSHPGAGRW